MNSPLQSLSGQHLTASAVDLHGTIEEELASSESGFSQGNVRLLRYHGVFQQDDRDSRHTQDGPRQYRFMVRIRATGGKFTASQLLGLLDLADEFGDGKLHITSRQGLQISNIEKSALRAVMRRIAALELTTLATGGHFGCNIMCCPAPRELISVSADLQATADRLDASLAPRVPAYDEIWQKVIPQPHARFPDDRPTTLTGRLSTDVAAHDQLWDGQAWDGRGAEQRVLDTTRPESRRANGRSVPLDGGLPLPQKFKIGLAAAYDNCAEVHAQDFGLLAVTGNGRVIGYNALIGGNMRNTFSVANRSSSLAKPLAFVDMDQVVPLVLAVVGVFREFGNRQDYTRARLKYLIQDWGVDQFRQVVERYVGPLEPPRVIEIAGHDDHLGWHRQDEQKWFVGIHVGDGHIADTGQVRLKSALTRIAKQMDCRVRLTPQRNILLCDVREADRLAIDAILAYHSIPAVESLSNVRRFSEGCPGLPQCPAAITESERRLPGLITALESEVERLGLADERFTLRITGCPFGCTRCYLADIAIVGRTVDLDQQQDKYAIFLGGDSLGRRLGTLYKDLVPADQIMETLRPVLLDFRERRLPGETLGDFFVRMGDQD